MWSLPDIVEMNQRAARKAEQNRLLKAVKTGKLDGKTVECEYCDKPATRRELYYDIFSDDPKGIAAFCDEHEDSYYESYFDCVDCGRRMVLNYTWEYYRHESDDGDICLPCYAKRIIDAESEWVVLTPENIQNLDFRYLRARPHCVGVRMPIPSSIHFFRNTEMDGSTGGRLTSSISCEDTPGGAVQEIRDYLNELRELGVTRALLIMDAAYQFSVSIGIYIPTGEKGRLEHGREEQSATTAQHSASR